MLNLYFDNFRKIVYNVVYRVLTEAFPMNKNFRNIDPKQFGEILKTLRKSKNLSQGEVADFLGIDRSTYTKYELGKIPDVSVIARLSAYYNVSADGILSVFFKEDSSGHTAVLNAVDEKNSLYLLSEDESRLIEAYRLCLNKDSIVDFAQAVYLEETICDLPDETDE